MSKKDVVVVHMYATFKKSSDNKKHKMQLYNVQRLNWNLKSVSSILSAFVCFLVWTVNDYIFVCCDEISTISTHMNGNSLRLRKKNCAKKSVDCISFLSFTQSYIVAVSLRCRTTCSGITHLLCFWYICQNSPRVRSFFLSSLLLSLLLLLLPLLLSDFVRLYINSTERCSRTLLLHIHINTKYQCECVCVLHAYLVY